MVKKCVICKDKIQEEYGKLKGTLIKARNEFGVNAFIHICSGCQREEGWYEKAMVRGA